MTLSFEISFFRHVGILYIKGTDFRIDPVPLKTVRPFVMDTVSLSKTDIDPLEHDKISNYLIEKVILYLCTLLLLIGTIDF